MIKGRGIMTYEEVVEKVREAYSSADATSVEEHAAIQFNIQGEGEGAFYLEILDGKIVVQPFEYFDRDATVFTTAATLQEIADGKMDVVEAFTTGKLHIEGNLGKAALLQNVKFNESEKKVEEPAAKKEVKAAAKTEVKAAAKAPAKKSSRKKK